MPRFIFRYNNGSEQVLTEQLFYELIEAQTGLDSIIVDAVLAGPNGGIETPYGKYVKEGE